MPDYEHQHKSDADILTDLQNITANVTAFSWNVDVPKATFTSAPTDLEKAKIAAYFESSDHCEWVSV